MPVAHPHPHDSPPVKFLGPMHEMIAAVECRVLSCSAEVVIGYPFSDGRSQPPICMASDFSSSSCTGGSLTCGSRLDGYLCSLATREVIRNGRVFNVEVIVGIESRFRSITAGKALTSASGSKL